MILYVARHGETDWNRDGRYQGQQESSLTQTGRAQARVLADALGARPLARTIASPLRRCAQTARPLAERADVPLELDARLLEIAHGSWEGRLREEIECDDPETMRSWRETPDRVRFAGGESLADVHARWRAFVHALGDEDGEVAIVTHDVLVRLAILDAGDRPLAQLWRPRVVNGGYARLALAGGRLRLLDECIDAHLGRLVVDTAHQAL